MRSTNHSDAPLERQLFIVQSLDGDFLMKIEDDLFRWTRDKQKAQRFTFEELNARGVTTTMMQRVLHGYGGARQIRVR